MATAESVGVLSTWKQDSRENMYHVYRSKQSPKPKTSTTTSPRYVRTWSQEEEAYLMEARRARVPYKDISTRLNKTDLACRLHYHQMVVARKNSMSEGSVTSGPDQHHPHHHHQSSSNYPMRADSLPPITVPDSRSMHYATPTPSEYSFVEPSMAGYGSHRHSTSHSHSHPQTPQMSKRPSVPSAADGVHKQSPSNSSRRQSNSVDLGRVQELYRDLAPGFWSNIAAAYSRDKLVSPGEIESAFFAGQNAEVCSESVSSGSNPGSPHSTAPSYSWKHAPPAEPSRAAQTSSYRTSSSAKDNRTKCSVHALLNK